MGDISYFKGTLCRGHWDHFSAASRPVFLYDHSEQQAMNFCIRAVRRLQTSSYRCVLLTCWSVCSDMGSCSELCSNETYACVDSRDWKLLRGICGAGVFDGHEAAAESDACYWDADYASSQGACVCSNVFIMMLGSYYCSPRCFTSISNLREILPATAEGDYVMLVVCLSVRLWSE